MKTSIRYKMKNKTSSYGALFLTISYGYKDLNDKFQQLKLSTKISIPVKDFSPSTGVKSSSSNSELKILVSRFTTDIEEKLYKISLEEKLSDVTPQRLRLLLSNTPENNAPKTLIEVVDRYIKTYEARNVKKFAKGTAAKHRTVLKQLKESGLSWRLKDINVKYVADYIDSQAPKYKLNTLWNLRKYIRKFCKVAKLGVDFSDEELVMSGEITTAIYLTFDKLKILMDYNFGTKMYLDRVRDGFLFQSFTGLRFSDFKQMAKFEDDKFGNEYVIIDETMKTGSDVCIPVLPPLKAILQKYNYDLPNDISAQKYNKYLKEIGELVYEKEEPVTCTYTKNGLKCTEVKEFWNMLSSHTARRSFASNFYELGIPSKFLMSALGMKKESTFFRYIRQTKKEQAKEIMKHVLASPAFQSVFSDAPLNNRSTVKGYSA